MTPDVIVMPKKTHLFQGLKKNRINTEGYKHLKTGIANAIPIA